MSISVAPFTPQYQPAAALFNERMRRANAPTAFLLPDRGKAAGADGLVTTTHFVALDDDGAVRGGMLCQEYPALVAGQVERVVNISAPLSEGIVDPAYMLVGPQLIRHALRQNPRAFVVGMGQSGNPLPRLLKAMGWTIGTVPFYFRVIRGARCARQLGPLRATSARRAVAGAAALTGAAWIGARLAHLPSAAARAAAARFDVEPVGQWDDRADAVWAAFVPSVSFAVARTREALPYLYPLKGNGPRAWWLRRAGRVDGWLGMQITTMSGNAYFGDLTVAVLTDCVGTPEAVSAGGLLAVEQARAAGADIIVTNQQHRGLQESCRAAGWRPGPSNFLVAASRALGKACHDERAYLTRRDGDGLANLTH